MIKVENIEIVGFDNAIRAIRSRKNSLNESDSRYLTLKNICNPYDCKIYYYASARACTECSEKHPDFKPKFEIGPNDLKFIGKLTQEKSTYSRFRSMITIYMDITAPLGWWKEFDSTVSKIGFENLILDNFEYDRPTRKLIGEYKSTVVLNYEALAKIYPIFKDDTMYELREFCKMIESLPYSEIITGK